MLEILVGGGRVSAELPAAAGRSTAFPLSGLQVAFSERRLPSVGMEIERLTTILREISQWEIAEDEEAATKERAADDDVDADVDTQQRASEAARRRLPGRRDS